MNILGIETSTHRLELGVWIDEAVVGVYQINKLEKHVESLVDSIQNLLSGLSIDLKLIDAVAVDIGPGLFTGIRTGIATAMAMVKSRNLKALPVTSLDILALQGGFVPCEVIVPVIDAKKDEVYAGVYFKNSSEDLNQNPTKAVRSVSNPSSIPLNDLFDHLGSINSIIDKKVVFLGSGANRYFEAINVLAKAENRFEVSVIQSEVFEVPDVKTLLRIAGDQILNEPELSCVLKPNYLRQANIKIGWQTRGGE